MNHINTGMKSTINHIPTVDDVNSFILTGHGIDSLNFAMSQLVDEGVSWNLDKTNAQVEYTLVTPESSNFWSSTTGGGTVRFDTKEEIAAAVIDAINATKPESSKVKLRSVTDSSVGVDWVTGGSYGSVSIFKTIFPEKTENIMLPINTISTQILANAIEGSAVSQKALTQITINKFTNDEFASELEANAVPYS